MQPPVNPMPVKPMVNPIKNNQKSLIVLLVLLVLVIGAGLVTGKVLATGNLKLGLNSTPTVTNSTTEAGVNDTSSFKDTAQGILRTGGANGEGDFHLERDGGPSQNVYLSSTVIDLGSFVDKKVQVWGQTLSAKKAGWLMDVGKVQVIQ